MRAEYALVVCLGGFAVFALALTLVNTAFYLRLKRYERATWKSLGSPMPLVNLDMENFAAVRAFLKSGSHRTLQDSRSVRLAGAVLVMDKLFLGFIAVASIVVGYIIFFVEP